MSKTTAEETESTVAQRRRLPRNVVLLGLVSMLNDISSEMSLTILPLFLANVLGVKTAVIGLIEGISETTASLSRPLFGWLSDVRGRRKPFAFAGYALSAFSKPFLYFAGNWGVVLGVRFADRLGKGVRTASRDALIADSTPPETRGLSFGFHRAADTAGAFIGLSVAALLVYLGQRGALTLNAGVYRNLVLAAMIPGFAAVLLMLIVRDMPKRVERGPREKVPLEPRFKALVAIMALFTLGNSSDAFLMLRAQNVGLSVFQISLVLVLFNAIYTAIATPAGAWSDKVGRRRVILLGWLIYGAVYLAFALAAKPWHIWAAFACYALYYALAEGTARALVADFVAPERRGVAYGMYSTAIAITALPASLIAGVLWQGIGGWGGLGPRAPFLFGSAMALLATILLANLLRRPEPA